MFRVHTTTRKTGVQFRFTIKPGSTATEKLACVPGLKESGGSTGGAAGELGGQRAAPCFFFVHLFLNAPSLRLILNTASLGDPLSLEGSFPPSPLINTAFSPWPPVSPRLLSSSEGFVASPLFSLQICEYLILSRLSLSYLTILSISKPISHLFLPCLILSYLVLACLNFSCLVF